MTLRNTKHSKQRLKERLNVSTKKEISTLLTQVMLYGRNPEEFIGELKNFLISKRNSKDKNVKIKVYTNNIYIYKGHILITSYPVPNKFLPIDQYYPLSDKLKREINRLRQKSKTQIESYELKIINTGDTKVAALYINDIFECFGQGTSTEESQLDAINRYIDLQK